MFMFFSHLSQGLFCLRLAVPLALILMVIFISIQLLCGKRTYLTPYHLITQTLWLIIVISILTITGIFDALFSGTFGVTSIFDGSAQIDFTLFSEGIQPATILNIILFMPYGFLSVLVFQKLKEKQIYGVLIGLIFTGAIEGLQLFTGRFVQLDDIIMNTLGTYIGYLIGCYALTLNLSQFKQIFRKNSLS